MRLVGEHNGAGRGVDDDVRLRRWGHDLARARATGRGGGGREHTEQEHGERGAHGVGSSAAHRAEQGRRRHTQFGVGAAKRSGSRPGGVPPWDRGSDLGTHRSDHGVGDARGRRQGQGAQGGRRERHRIRRGRARLPDARAHRRGRGRGVPRPSLPPLHADARAARAPRSDRAQDEARLRRRRRGRAGPRHQRRQARRVQHVPGAVRPRRRSAAAGAVLDVVPRDDHARRRRSRRAADHRGRRASASSLEQLDAAVTPRTKALLFVSPSNPTGAVYPPSEVEAIGRWAVERGIWVITDEIYEHLTYGDHVFASMPRSFPSIADRCVILNGVAKTYAMTGWRVGWMIGPRDVIGAATNLQSHSTSNVSNVAQAAALAAVRGDLDAVAMMRDAFARRGRMMYELLAGIPGVTCLEPQGAFYCFPSFVGVLGREIAGRTPARHARAVRAAARGRQGRDRARRGVRRARLRPALVRPRRRRPRRRRPAASPTSWTTRSTLERARAAIERGR